MSKCLIIALLFLSMPFVVMPVSGMDIQMSDARIFLGGVDVRVKSQWIQSNNGLPKLSSGDYARKIVVGDRVRYYKIHVPKGYNPEAEIPMVLLFHGGGGYPDAIRYQSGMDRVSDREKFIVVYPAGYNRRVLKDRLLVWNDGRLYQDGTPSRVDDVSFVKAIIADIQSILKVDTHRIYAAGFSNGAQFSYHLVKNMPNTIAAIAAVAGQRSAYKSGQQCSSVSIPVMQFSGKKDFVAPYEGGSPKFKPVYATKLDSVNSTITSWAKCNGCDLNKPLVTKHAYAEEKKWVNCRKGASVILWSIKDGGHTWPGGKTFPAEKRYGVGNVSMDINASDLMWEFFKAHSL